MTAVRVLVLGASGRIGKMLRRIWTQAPLHAAGTNIEFTFQTRRVCENHPGDLLWDALQHPPKALTDAAPFDCMVVLSGIVPKPGADLTLNTALGSACVTAAAGMGIPHVLLASTSAVYGIHSNSPFSEDDPLDPVNDYGRSKREMEAACQTQAAAAGVALCCLRIGNVAGADALLGNGAALAPGARLQLETFKDRGTPVRSYIGPQSLAHVILSLIQKRDRLPVVLNIAAPRPVSMRALAEAADIAYDLCPANDDAHQYVTLTCDTLAALHRFEPAEAEPCEMVRQWRALTDI
ncbi:NAD-dependent epimerase/dehydratase family protein [Sulfitobacter sp.]|uniref:NAD-dependent epimerase/dehydratase family protein n=1 Tax=Sulfitobacter sp. TaxID=1903071 RepID=UPI003EF6C07A